MLQMTDLPGLASWLSSTVRSSAVLLSSPDVGSCGHTTGTGLSILFFFSYEEMNKN
jgi:hypothetical protein